MSDILRRALGPSWAIVKDNRAMLRRALWIRVRHPRAWADAKRSARP